MVCIALLFVRLGVSQTTQGQLNGRITDTTGAVIPGAGLSATNPLTDVQIKTTSNEAGQYVLYLAAATYDVRITSARFAPPSDQ